MGRVVTHRLMACDSFDMVREENFMTHKMLHTSDDPREIAAYIANRPNMRRNCARYAVYSSGITFLTIFPYPEWAKVYL